VGGGQDTVGGGQGTEVRGQGTVGSGQWTVGDASTSPLPPGDGQGEGSVAKISPRPLAGEGQGVRADVASGLTPPAYYCYLGDDWTTWGDWVGRYGRQHNVLCAAATPFDHNMNWDNHYTVVAKIDDKYAQDGKDSLRGWIHWAETRNHKTLYDPVAGVRRQSEWDDHGEAYPANKEGPNINVRIRVPEGVHRVSAYFFNKDGHAQKNRFRDYLLTLYRYKIPVDLTEKETPPFYQPDNLKPLGRARVCDFWGGVYKIFIVAGPGDYLLRIEKNNSFNTNVCGIFIDKLGGPITRYDDLPIAFLGGIKFKAPEMETPESNEELVIKRARDLWGAALEAQCDPLCAHFCRICQLMAYRSAVSANAATKLLQNWRWYLGLRTEDDRVEFARTMDEGWEKQITCEPKMIWQKTRRKQSDSSYLVKQNISAKNEHKKNMGVQQN
jgi:hypothetical protein